MTKYLIGFNGYEDFFTGSPYCETLESVPVG